MAGTQSSLIKIHGDELTPTPSFPRLARSTDPETSKKAAREMETSGQRETNEDFAVRMVRRWPGSTAAELEVIAGQEGDRTVSKRLSGAEGHERVFSVEPKEGDRVCEQTGRPAKFWYPVVP